MNKNSVITAIHKDARYYAACKNITHNSVLCDDLYQEVIIILLSDKKVCIVSMYNDNKLLYYFISLCKMLYRPGSKTSPFMRKHRGILESNLHSAEGVRFESIIQNEVENTLIDVAIKDLSEKKQNRELNYEQQLINAIIKEGEMKSLIKKTGITNRAMKGTIDNFKQRIENESKSI